MKAQSKVMTIANKLVKNGYNRSNAMVKAWVLVKMPLVESKVMGVTYGNRQKALEHLLKYDSQSIVVSLYRDKANTYDKNAIAVIVSAGNSKGYCIGYLPKALAAFIAPLMDTRKAVTGKFKEIRGQYEPYMNLGMVIQLAI